MRDKQAKPMSEESYRLGVERGAYLERARIRQIIEGYRHRRYHGGVPEFDRVVVGELDRLLAAIDEGGSNG